MADELLRALAEGQRKADAAEPPPIADAVDGDAGEGLLDDLFAELDARPPADDVPAPATVTELPRRSPTTWTAVAVAVAVAAALALWFAVRAPAAPGMPAYTAVAISGGPAAVRGEGDAVASTVTLETPSGAIDWRFAPATPVEGGVEVVLVARSADAEPVVSKATGAEIKDSGSVRLRGPLDGFIDLAPGAWTIDVVFAAKGHAPDSATDADDANDENGANDANDGGGWPRHTIEVIISAP